MTGRILLVEDDETFRSFVQTILEDEGHEIVLAGDGHEGEFRLNSESFDLVISDLKMPGLNGIELFRRTRQDPDPPPFIFLTAFGTVAEAVAAIKEGAADFLTKPLPSPETLLALVQRIIENQNRNREFLTLKATEAAGLPPLELIFAGKAMENVSKLVNDVAATTANVLIYGESGTGKELIARIIHHLSTRKNSVFIAVNCAAIPDNLLESELFGHEKGAFTGAIQSRQGKFELARGGTLFLDEIGEMPFPLQSKLLRVIQERVFERVGGTKEIKADIRVIAASNRRLQDEVAERRFREDLFYRLNVFPINLPPLRERADAVPDLSDYFLRRFSSQTGKKLGKVDPEVISALQRYGWPGNIRELQNVMERAVILARDKVSCSNLPDEIFHEAVPGKTDSREVLKSVERDMIVKALKNNRGNRRMTAEEIGISRRSLQYKLKEYDLIEE